MHGPCYGWSMCQASAMLLSQTLLMAVRDCIVNKKSQGEIVRKYGIPQSRVQWTMSGKKEHKKGGKQYQQERKRKRSEEDSIKSQKLRKNEKEQEKRKLERVDDRPTLVAGSHNNEDNNDELPEPAITTFGPFQDHPHTPIGNILEKVFSNNYEK